MISIEKGKSPREIAEHLGLSDDESVKDLGGDGAELGAGNELLDLGIDDEWVLLISYKYGFKDGEWDDSRQVYQVCLLRGSISKKRRNQNPDWKRHYPYWRKGAMITNPTEKGNTEQDAGGKRE